MHFDNCALAYKNLNMANRSNYEIEIFDIARRYLPLTMQKVLRQ